MGIFKINKTQDYVVMSNHHLRNKNLTLKAKGLLSQMLSLPDDWDYTLAGLAHINKESIDAVRTAVWELEKEGYIEKTRERDEKGKLDKTIYNIYEVPPKNNLDPKPQAEKDTNNKIKTNNLSNTNKDNKNKEVTKKNETENLQKSNMAPLNSITQTNIEQQKDEKESNDNRRERIGKKDIYEYNKYREIIKNNIEYDWWVENHESAIPQIDEMINIILEILSSQKETLNIAGDDYPAELVKERFKKIDGDHIGFVIDCMKENNTKIRNIKKLFKNSSF